MTKFFLAFTILSCLTLVGCSAGYVANRPPDLRYARAVSPGPGYVWTSGNWKWNGRKYYWKEGSWQRSKAGSTWKSGYWEHNANGYKWHKAHWE